MTLLLAALLWLGLIGLLVGALWLAYRRPPTVTLSRTLSTSAFAGGRIPLTVQAKVFNLLPVRVLIEDEPPRTVVADTVPVLAGWVQGEAIHEVQTTLTLNRRGVFQWEGGTLRWADPLGLFWRSLPLKVPTRLEVYPGTHGLLLPDLLRPLLSEGAWSRTHGLEDPISLRGVRDYVPGDPPGRVHWRLTARTGSLTVRVPERTAASSVTIYLDLSGGGDVYLESAVRLAASLVQESFALDLPISVATNAGATPTGRSPEAMRAALLRLAQAVPDADSPTIPPIRSGGNLIILTARAGGALIEQAMRARATASRVALIAIPDGFYMEPGEKPRRQWVAAPDSIRELERQAGALAGVGVIVFVLRGNQSGLRLGG
ncbi:DUF58 domain-containing protein [Deinococcus sp. QL22]|uniref:DUF58 domain-containing protein n=1 Tax=Deinococcus sp. QL22 TaxID=2939437 RepID=UPI0020176618|nr:DUF58 domain-containing protein [Deinococcus sp. QL22]UQN05964.1 DUF58 domain-containing protein [Deinococcus sp. QL22]